MLNTAHTPQTRESALTTAVADITTASRKLAAIAAQQASHEATIQDLCNAVWAVEQKQYSVSGKCGEAQQYTVTHQYTQNLAAINADTFGALQQHMRQHLRFAASELASALFEHALCEEHLIVLADMHVLRSDLAPAELQQLLAVVCAPLLASDLDPRSLPCLRRIALGLGCLLLDTPHTAPAPADELPDLLGGPSSSTSSSTYSQPDGSSAQHASAQHAASATPAAMLQLVWHGRGCGWAAPLLQPAISDLVESRWLWCAPLCRHSPHAYHKP